MGQIDGNYARHGLDDRDGLGGGDGLGEGPALERERTLERRRGRGQYVGHDIAGLIDQHESREIEEQRLKAGHEHLLHRIARLADGSQQTGIER